MNSPHTTTIVIKHPVSVTKEFLLGQESGFPDGNTFLNPAVIRRAVMALTARGVQKLKGGTYHGDIHTFGMRDLLSGVSAHDFKKQVEQIEMRHGSEKTKLIFAGVRWEVSDKPREVRIYGPKSDPDNTVVIDLTTENQ